MEFYIAQGISIVIGILAVIMMQFKSMTKILVFQILCNLLTALTYFLLGGFSGAGICVIAIVQSVTMFLYNIKKVEPHKPVIVAFISLQIFVQLAPVWVLLTPGLSAYLCSMRLNKLFAPYLKPAETEQENTEIA